IGGVTLPSYRGDIINGIGFTKAERTPDPRRLLEAYSTSALTLNFVRSLVGGGFADLHHPEYWNQGFVHESDLAAEYQQMLDTVQAALAFAESVADGPISGLKEASFYISHEALHLH